METTNKTQVNDKVTQKGFIMKTELKYLRSGDLKLLAEHISGEKEGKTFKNVYQKVRDAKRGYRANLSYRLALEKLNEERKKEAEALAAEYISKIK